MQDLFKKLTEEMSKQTGGSLFPNPSMFDMKDMNDIKKEDVEKVAGIFSSVITEILKTEVENDATKPNEKEVEKQTTDFSTPNKKEDLFKCIENEKKDEMNTAISKDELALFLDFIKKIHIPNYNESKKGSFLNKQLTLDEVVSSIEQLVESFYKLKAIFNANVEPCERINMSTVNLISLTEYAKELEVDNANFVLASELLNSLYTNKQFYLDFLKHVKNGEDYVFEDENKNPYSIKVVMQALLHLAEKNNNSFDVREVLVILDALQADQEMNGKTPISVSYLISLFSQNPKFLSLLSSIFINEKQKDELNSILYPMQSSTKAKEVQEVDKEETIEEKEVVTITKENVQNIIVQLLQSVNDENKNMVLTITEK